MPKVSLLSYVHLHAGQLLPVIQSHVFQDSSPQAIVLFIMVTVFVPRHNGPLPSHDGTLASRDSPLPRHDVPLLTHGSSFPSHDGLLPSQDGSLPRLHGPLLRRDGPLPRHYGPYGPVFFHVQTLKSLYCSPS